MEPSKGRRSSSPSSVSSSPLPSELTSSVSGSPEQRPDSRDARCAGRGVARLPELIPRPHVARDQYELYAAAQSLPLIRLPVVSRSPRKLGKPPDKILEEQILQLRSLRLPGSNVECYFDIKQLIAQAVFTFTGKYHLHDYIVPTTVEHTKVVIPQLTLKGLTKLTELQFAGITKAERECLNRTSWITLNGGRCKDTDEINLTNHISDVIENVAITPRLIGAWFPLVASVCNEHAVVSALKWSGDSFDWLIYNPTGDLHSIACDMYGQPRVNTETLPQGVVAGAMSDFVQMACICMSSVRGEVCVHESEGIRKNTKRAEPRPSKVFCRMYLHSMPRQNDKICSSVFVIEDLKDIISGRTWGFPSRVLLQSPFFPTHNLLLMERSPISAERYSFLCTNVVAFNIKVPEPYSLLHTQDPLMLYHVGVFFSRYYSTEQKQQFATVLEHVKNRSVRFRAAVGGKNFLVNTQPLVLFIEQILALRKAAKPGPQDDFRKPAKSSVPKLPPLV